VLVVDLMGDRLYVRAAEVSVRELSDFGKCWDGVGSALDD